MSRLLRCDNWQPNDMSQRQTEIGPGLSKAWIYGKTVPDSGMAFNINSYTDDGDTRTIGFINGFNSSDNSIGFVQPINSGSGTERTGTITVSTTTATFYVYNSGTIGKQFMYAATWGVLVS